MESGLRPIPKVQSKGKVLPHSKTMWSIISYQPSSWCWYWHSLCLPI